MAHTDQSIASTIAVQSPRYTLAVGWLSSIVHAEQNTQPTNRFSYFRMPSFPEAPNSAAARKQVLQDQVLAIIQGRRLAGIALTMG
ncbi:MAG: hypothetical protein EOO61_15115, partial [Hymenobacter sp.]